MKRISPAWITDLRPGEIFVFGSNTKGWHGKGAALIAKGRFGAIQGQSFGLMGQSFAIPTKGPDPANPRKLVSLPLDSIGVGITMFLGFAYATPKQTYLVTEIGCGLAGYSPEQIVPLFFRTDYITKPDQIPANVSLPASFWKVMYPDRG